MDFYKASVYFYCTEVDVEIVVKFTAKHCRCYIFITPIYTYQIYITV